MKYRTGDLIIFKKPLMGMVSDGGFILKEIFSVGDIRRIIETDEKYYIVGQYVGVDVEKIKVKHKDLETVAEVYGSSCEAELADLRDELVDDMIEGLAEEAQPEEPVKLYTWQDLCDYEILLYEKWRIANEQRTEQGQELSVMHTLRQEYMEAIKRAMAKLGREVPADKAKELGFEV